MTDGGVWGKLGDVNKDSVERTAFSELVNLLISDWLICWIPVFTGTSGQGAEDGKEISLNFSNINDCIPRVVVIRADYKRISKHKRPGDYRASWNCDWLVGYNIGGGNTVLCCDTFSFCFRRCWARNCGLFSFGWSHTYRCCASIPAAVDNSLVYCLGILCRLSQG